MRRLLSFACEGATLGAAASTRPSGTTGLLLVTGGSQTRIGSHRMYERLAKALAERLSLLPLRPPRRRRQRAARIPASAAAAPISTPPPPPSAASSPQLKRVVGFGLCDGATALALHGDAAGLDG